MYLREKCYDIEELMQENLHVHTTFSGCAKVGMRIKEIVKRAEELNLKTVALVDHFNDRNVPMIEKNIADKFIADDMETDVKFLFGAELSAFGVGKWLDSDEVNSKLDYRLYAANHYHLDYWEQPTEKTPRGYAEHTVKVLTTLILSGRADCIAHPVAGAYVKCLDNPLDLSKAITDNELGEILTLAKDNFVAWEINQGEALWDRDLTRRFWNIGKEVGVVFHFGTDAHTLEGMDTRAHLDDFKILLD